MTKKKIPAPGKKLVHNITFVESIKSMIEDIAMNKVEDATILDDLLSDIKDSLKMNVDDYQFILDNLGRANGQLIDKVDVLNEQTFLLDACIATLEQHIIDKLKTHAEGRISGETFSYELEKTNPTIVIDDKLIPLEATRRIPNQVYIGNLIAKGQSVPGVSVKENFKLVKSVNKKEIKNGEEKRT